MKQVLTFLLAILLLHSSLYAQAGSIDSSFGVNGTVLRTDLVGAHNDVYGRFNDRILASRLVDTTAYITQYRKNGTPEKTIRLSSVDIEGAYSTLKGSYKVVTANADEQIYGVGDIEEFDQTTVFIARFHKDGSVDSSFGENGAVRYYAGNFPGGLIFIIQPDNKLLLSVSEVYDAVPTIYRFTLIRYLPNGTLDSSFGYNGFLKFLPGYSSMQLQHDGKIVFASGYKNIQLSRRNVNGSLDSSFGINGTALINVPYLTGPFSSFGISQLTIQPNNKILIPGRGDNYATLTRCNADGTLDSSFGENGFVRTNLYSSSAYIDLLPAVVQPDGKIILGGKTGVYYPIKPDTSFLIRLNRNGTLDKTFGNSGYVQYVNATTTYIYDIALQPDGKILTCGSRAEFKPNGTFSAYRPFITRYNGDAADNTVAKMVTAIPKQLNVVISVYPNPATDVLYMNTKKSIEIQLTNSSGKTVLRRNINGNTTIPVSQLPSGIYFLSTPEQSVQKIVINH